MFDFGLFPELSTERLRLREICANDASAIFALRSDFEVTRHNIGAAYTHIGQAETLISAIVGAYQQKAEVRWGITLPDATLVGVVGFNYWQRNDRRAAVGFELQQAYWGQGLMSEALTAVLNFGFSEMHLNRIEATTSADNTRSLQLLLRLGFSLEGRQREQFFEEGRFHDLFLLGLLHRDWEARTTP